MRWSWLGDHLALDVVNTVRRRGMSYVELWRTPADLAEWLNLEAHRLPPPPEADDALLARVRALRGAALRVLRAAATDAPLPPGPRDTLNRTAADHPAVRVLGDAAGEYDVRALTTGPDALVAVLAAAILDALTDPANVARLALCDAPGCGQLYLRDRPNQQWCNPHCGARARSDRQRRPA